MRLEEWRLKRRDTEEWMRHRQLPEDQKQRVRRFVQYKWLATRGVDEETILTSLPTDLRRDIQRHLCLDLVRRVCFMLSMFASLELKTRAPFHYPFPLYFINYLSVYQLGSLHHLNEVSVRTNSYDTTNKKRHKITTA